MDSFSLIGFLPDKMLIWVQFGTRYFIDYIYLIIGIPLLVDFLIVWSPGLGLSFGQIKQIAIARTIYKDPKIVLLDEPSLGLDNNSAKNLINLIQHLKNEKKTIIFTSHASNLLLLANKVMVLEKGKVISFDKTEKIIKKIN